MSDAGESLFSTPEMSAIFSPEAHVRAMLRFEAALARAEAQANIIPKGAAEVIASTCQQSERFDTSTIYQQGAQAGTLVIPLVQLLTEQVEGDARRFVHWGATSQDTLDSALMLQIRDALDLLLQHLETVCTTCAQLSEEHRHTLMVGRTLLQQALPITFGLKAARWLALLTRQAQALDQLRTQALALQFGGAVGTLASLGDNGLRVMELLAQELELPAPDLPWHTERDRIVRIATTLATLAGALAKIAGDVLLLTQSEVAEVSEGSVAGKGGSSTMPQKHNPVDATFALSAARLASGTLPIVLSTMQQEHERAAGSWQAEWHAIPDLFRYTASAVARVQHLLAHLHVDVTRMQSNLAATRGLVMAESLAMALAPHIGRAKAQSVVKATCEHAMQTGSELQQAAQADKTISATLSSIELAHALDPTNYLGMTDAFIDRALAAYHLQQKTDSHVDTLLTSDGLRLTYRVDGLKQGRTIVMLNSLGTNLHMWDPQIEQLSTYLRIVRYDSRGHGASETPSASYPIAQLGADLIALLDTLGIEQAYLCGLSLGGLVAQWCAIAYPTRIAGLLLANTAARIGSVETWGARIAAVRAGGMRAIRDAVLARFLSPTYRRTHPTHTQQLGTMLERVDPEGYMKACEVLRDTDLRGRVGGIHVPSLILVGALDEATPPAQAEELHAAIAGSKLFVLPDVAHLSNWEAPETFNACILRLMMEKQ